MEYTKDIIFNTRYDKVKMGINLKGGIWTSKFWKKVKNHKIISLIVSTTLIVIVFDFVLIYNFFTILSRI